jgi:hypothetical protein
MRSWLRDKKRHRALPGAPGQSSCHLPALAAPRKSRSGDKICMKLPCCYRYRAVLSVLHASIAATIYVAACCCHPRLLTYPLS